VGICRGSRNRGIRSPLSARCLALAPPTSPKNYPPASLEVSTNGLSLAGWIAWCLSGRTTGPRRFPLHAARMAGCADEWGMALRLELPDASDVRYDSLIPALVP